MLFPSKEFGNLMEKCMTQIARYSKCFVVAYFKLRFFCPSSIAISVRANTFAKNIMAALTFLHENNRTSSNIVCNFAVSDGFCSRLCEATVRKNVKFTLTFETFRKQI